MPPKTGSKRKKTVHSNTDTGKTQHVPRSGKKRKQTPNEGTGQDHIQNMELDYTKLAKEIIRLQKDESVSPLPSTNAMAEKTMQQKNAVGDNLTTVSVNHPLLDVGREINAVQPGTSGLPAIVTQSQDTPTITAVSVPATTVSTEQIPAAATPVVSLLDKIFAGETSASNNQLTFRPSDGIPLGASVPSKTKTKIWNNEFVEMRSLLPYFKEDPLSVSITPGTITLQ